MSFLLKLWAKLDSKRTNNEANDVKAILEEVYPGYRSIKIQ